MLTLLLPQQIPNCLLIVRLEDTSGIPIPAERPARDPVVPGGDGTTNSGSANSD